MSVRMSRQIKRVFGVFFALLLPICANANTNTDTALVIRGWTPTLTLAGSPPIESALSLIKRTLELNEIVLHHTQLNPELEQMSDKIVKSLSKFDLEKLYQLLPEKTDGRHSLAVAGTPKGKQYHVSRVPASDINEALTDFGQSYQLLSLKPRNTSRGNAYQMRMRLKTNVDTVSWDSILDAFRDTLLTLEQPAPEAASADAVARIAAMDKQLSHDEQQILSQFYTAFPTTLDWYTSIGKLTDFYADKQPSSKAKHIHMVFALNRRPLKNKYPDVATYLKKLGDFLTAKLTVSGVEGDWLTTKLDTGGLKAELDFWVADGYLVPSVGGRPMLKDVLRPIPDTATWQSNLKLTARAFGVVIDISQLKTRWKYQKTINGADTIGTLSTKPNVDITGRFFGIIPSGLVENLSPINVRGVVDDFMSVLITSNNRGATLAGSYNDGGDHGSIVAFGLDGDGLDNFFVRLGMGMLSKRVIPSPKQADDLRKLAGDAVASYERDLNHWTPVLLNHAKLARQKANAAGETPTAATASEAAIMKSTATSF